MTNNLYVDEMTNKIEDRFYRYMHDLKFSFEKNKWVKNSKPSENCLRALHKISQDLERLYEDNLITHIKVIRLLKLKSLKTLSLINYFQQYRKHGLLKVFTDMFPSCGENVRKEPRPLQFTGRMNEGLMTPEGFVTFNGNDATITSAPPSSFGWAVPTQPIAAIEKPKRVRIEIDEDDVFVPKREEEKISGSDKIKKHIENLHRRNYDNYFDSFAKKPKPKE